MSELRDYVVYSAPDDRLDPTVFQNGVCVGATDHENAVLERLSLAHGYCESGGAFWVSGRDENGNLKLRKIRFRATAFEIYRGLGDS